MSERVDSFEFHYTSASAMVNGAKPSTGTIEAIEMSEFNPSVAPRLKPNAKQSKVVKFKVPLEETGLNCCSNSAVENDVDPVEAQKGRSTAIQMSERVDSFEFHYTSASAMVNGAKPSTGTIEAIEMSEFNPSVAPRLKPNAKQSRVVKFKVPLEETGLNRCSNSAVENDVDPVEAQKGRSTAIQIADDCGSFDSCSDHKALKCNRAVSKPKEAKPKKSKRSTSSRRRKRNAADEAGSFGQRWLKRNDNAKSLVFFTTLMFIDALIIYVILKMFNYNSLADMGAD